MKLPAISEREFQQQVIALAKLRGFRVAHFRPARVMRNGKETYETPVAADGKGFLDLVMLREHRLIVAELKSEKGQLTKEQHQWIQAWLLVPGVEVYVWRPSEWSEIEKVLMADMVAGTRRLQAGFAPSM